MRIVLVDKGCVELSKPGLSSSDSEWVKVALPNLCLSRPGWPQTGADPQQLIKGWSRCVRRDFSAVKVPWSSIRGRWEWDMPCNPCTLNLRWLKWKRFGMAVEKSGHAMFSVWRSWWAHLVGPGFRGEFMVVVGRECPGRPQVLRDTQRVTITS